MILEQLRLKTGPQHKEIESALPLLAEDFSLENYKRLLSAWAPVHRYFDHQIWRHPQWQQLGLNPAVRLKSGWLEQDLRHFGLKPQPPESFAFTHCHDFPEALGCAYVIEGSALGSQLISKHLAKRWQISADQGGRYYSFYAEQTGPFWRAYLAGLEQANKDFSVSDQERLVEAAVQTFSSLTLHFQKHVYP